MPSRPVKERASDGQDTACRIVERASPTLRRSKTQLKCQSLRPQGALRSVRVIPEERGRVKDGYCGLGGVCGRADI